MNPAVNQLNAFLQRLHQLGIRLSLQQGELRFKAPKGVMTPELINQIRENKSAIVAILQQAEGRAKVSLNPIRVDFHSDSREKNIPLSYAQQRLWFLYRMEGAAPTYNILMACRFKGPLDVAALKHSFDYLIERHESLRTTFQENSAGLAEQVVHASQAANIRINDFSSLSEAEKATRLTKLKQGLAETCFNLEQGPLSMVELVHYSQTSAQQSEWVLLMAMHHIIGDGWSMGILSRELSHAYYHLRRQQLPQLEQPKIHYRDYAIWQKQAAQLEYFQQGIKYWRDLIADCEHHLELSVAKKPSSQRDYQGAVAPLILSSQLTEKLSRLADKQGVSLFTLLLSAYFILLQRYSGRDELLLGTQVANRDDSQLEPLVGFFINTIPLRANLRGNPTFQDLLSQVKDFTLQAFEWQSIPFERLVDALQIERNSTYNPLVQSMFLWQNAGIEAIDLEGLQTLPEPLQSVAAKFDLTLELGIEQGQIQGVFEYSLDLYSETAIVQMAEHYSQLLELIAAQPQIRIGQLSLTGHNIQDVAIVKPPFRHDKPHIIACFNHQVATNPNVLAVSDGKRQMSYQQLSATAELFALRIRQAGIKPGSLVAIQLPKNCDYIAAIFAILRAGCAYLPLEASLPAARIDYILENARASAIIGQQGTACDLTMISVAEAQAEELEQLRHQVTSIEIPTCSLAYVIYTSGSTGKPKGVAIQQHAVLNLVASLEQQIYAKNPHRHRIALMASFVFDASVQQIFAALLKGHSLHIIDSDLRRDGRALLDYLTRHQISLSDATPSLLRIMLDAGLGTYPESCLEHLIVGGEALDSALVRQFCEATSISPIQLHNVYGPTECTVDSSCYSLDCKHKDEYSVVSLGQALAHAQIQIVDQYGNLQAHGLAGEIWISGAALACGYWQQAALTAAAFVPGKDGQRWYRSGDLGFWDEHGELHYIARIDDQVKVRGFRIELGEIESQLLALASVEQAAVILISNPSSNELAAYLVASEPLSQQKLRQDLEKNLPDYMLPAHFIQLPQLPLNNSGKVDRKALANLGKANRLSDKSSSQAQGQMEKLLAQTWCQVLGLEQMGREENFFAAGGDSIKALQIVSRLRQHGWHMEVRDLFTHSSVAQLAPKLVALQKNADTPTQNPSLLSGPVALNPIQIQFFSLHQGNFNHFNQAFLLAPQKPLHAHQLTQALQKVCQQHAAFRLRYEQKNAQWQQFYIDKEQPLFDFQQVNLNSLMQIDAEAEAVQRSFDLFKGPLFKVVWYQAGRECRLLFVAHHLIIDGVSWRILMEDLNQAYQLGENWHALEASMSSQAWMQQLLQKKDNIVTEQWSYWEDMLVQSTGPFIDEFCRYSDLAVLDLDLNPDFSRLFLTGVHHRYNTESNDILLAALAIAYKQWRFNHELILALEGHGRDTLPGSDVSRTIGWFTTRFPVHLKVVHDSDYGVILKSIKEQLRALPNKGLAYGVKRYLDVHSKLSIAANREPAISFNYLGQFGQEQQQGLFSMASEAFGTHMDPQASPPYLIEFVGKYHKGILSFELAYSEKHYSYEDIWRLQEYFKQALEDLIKHCAASQESCLTPADIDYDGFNIATLENFLGQLKDSEQLSNLYPLTPLQEGMLFHALADESEAYTQQIAYLLQGEFDQQRFMQSWQQLIQRHEVLRNRIFMDASEQPLQGVMQSQPLELEKIDLRDLSPEQQQQRRKQIKQRDRKQGFNLNRSNLMRFSLLILGDDLTEVLWTHHHIVMDGWSLGILLQEGTQLYEQPHASLSHSPPFSTYVKWLQQQDQNKALAFWKDYLKDYQNEIKLPYKNLKNEVDTTVRHRAEFSFKKSLLSQLQNLSEQLHVTLNSILQGAWGILLGRYNDCDDVVFGCAVSGRPADIERVEQIVGLFINTIPVRAKVKGNSTIKAYLQKIQDDALEAEAFHFAPLNAIQSQTALQNRLISTHFTLENFPLDERFKQLGSQANGSLNVQASEINELTHYPLDLQILPSADGIKVKMAYETTYAKNMTDYIERHFSSILEQIAASPEKTLAQIELVSPAERQQLMQWGQVNSPTLKFVSLLERFKRALDSRPQDIAVVHNHQQLTYAELDGLSNALANRILSQGTKGSAHIALYFERGLEMITAILAVLKAGMVYVPIDPKIPAERIQFILADAEIELILHDQNQVPKGEVAQLEFSVADLKPESPTQNLRAQHIQASDSAYIIYTSGSTGKPKGVVVSHANMAALFDSADQCFDFNHNDVWCLFHSYGFDFSVWEIWGALAYGGKLVIVPYWISRSPVDFHAFIQQYGISVLNQTPTAFNQLIEVDQQSDTRLDSLRYIIFGGEALDYSALVPWYQRYSHASAAQLVNMYGITETTVHVSVKAVYADDCQNRLSVIGRPLAHLGVVILDQYGHLSPIGVAGEMYINGMGVCHGYLNRQELTAQRFVQLPQLSSLADTTQTTQRFYRTGDMGRFLDNGEIEYLGRCDQQIQLHGFRIETGEIEQVMMQNSGIEKAIVTLFQGENGQRSLLAYYTCAERQPIDVAELREYLSRYLPVYMLPGQFIHLLQIPITANGKLDRQALPSPLSREQQSAEKSAEKSPIISAENPQQQLLCDIWAELLNRENVGIEDNFFALGGDSIQAIRVVSRLRQNNFMIEVRDLFRYPTIAELTPWLKALNKVSKTSEQNFEPLLTPIQHWFFQAYAGHLERFNHVALLQARDDIWHINAVDRAWENLLEQHQVLRSRFQQTADGWQVSYAENVNCKVQSVSLMHLDDYDDAMQKHADELQGSFDLQQAPLIRLVIYQCPTGDRLMIVIHHLLVDGVSWRILLEDFSQLYENILNNQYHPIIAESDSYSCWSQQLQAYAQSQTLYAEISYWQAMIKTEKPSYWRSQATVYEHAENLHRFLDRQQTQILTETVNAAYSTTTEEILLTALGLTFDSWGDIQQSIILLEGHGRENLFKDVSVERTVGWFTALYPLLLAKPATEDMGYWIKSIKELLRKIPHKGLGYGVLRYLDSLQQAGGENLQFEPDIVFNYLGRFDTGNQKGKPAALMTPLTLDTGRAVSGLAKRPCALEFSAMIRADQLHIDWRYDMTLFSTNTMQNLADEFIRQLLLLVDFCVEKSKQQSQELTPSDLTYSDISLEELDDIFS